MDTNQKQKPKFVAIKVNGILKDSKIEDNTCINADLLEADGVENSFINRNKVISLENEKTKKERFLSKFFWWILSIVAAVVAAVVLNLLKL